MQCQQLTDLCKNGFNSRKKLIGDAAVQRETCNLFRIYDRYLAECPGNSHSSYQQSYQPLKFFNTAATVQLYMHNATITTILQPLDFVWNYSGEPVPEK